MIDFIASQPHFADHLRPIWDALPDQWRGQWFTSKPPRSSNLTVVAAFGDVRLARNAGRRVVLSEHGSGQSYRGTTSPSYIGAPDRHGVVAVLVPGEAQAQVHMRAHPKIPAHVIGCPKLDDLHSNPRTLTGEPVVAVSWHWDCAVVPETRSAWRYYKGAIVRLAERYKVLGHGHPRHMDMLAGWYRKNGIEVIADFAEVCERASVYVVDNSSTLFEFASLDKPVVVVNCNLYRRSIEHGGRFWEHADIGVQVDRPADLTAAITEALIDPPQRRARRREIVRQIYAVTDGTASQLAASALIEEAHKWRSASASNSTTPV